MDSPPIKEKRVYVAHLFHKGGVRIARTAYVLIIAV